MSRSKKHIDEIGEEVVVRLNEVPLSLLSQPKVIWHARSICPSLMPYVQYAIPKKHGDDICEEVAEWLD